ncbi:MAG TPA: acyltransferase [Lachnospiraceae bacterium]|nr:acyltransferase [Lachnospiraceae bacterium]
MRKYYIDNIRWATVLLVLVYHVFYLFNHVGVLGNVGSPGDVYYQDAILYFVYPWFMVLLFLIAGISSRYALNKCSDKEFLKSKVTKLLVPSTLGLFVYQWIGGYLNVKIGGGLDYMPSFLRYPIFVLSGTGPLWFIQMLFLFSALLVLIRKLKVSEKLWELCGKSNIIILILLVIPIWGAAQILNMPVITTYRFGIYFMVYLIGYFVFSHDEVQDKVERIHIPMLLVAVVLGIGYTIFYFGQNYADAACLQSIFTNVYLWIAVLAILGCGKAWFDRTSRFAEYMTKASFGLYIVHYPIVLIACYVLINYLELPIILTYLLALLLELVLTPAVYELFRRIPVVRYLVLGIKKIS